MINLDAGRLLGLVVGTAMLGCIGVQLFLPYRGSLGSEARAAIVIEIVEVALLFLGLGLWKHLHSRIALLGLGFYTILTCGNLVVSPDAQPLIFVKLGIIAMLFHSAYQAYQSRKMERAEGR